MWGGSLRASPERTRRSEAAARYRHGPGRVKVHGERGLPEASGRVSFHSVMLRGHRRTTPSLPPSGSPSHLYRIPQAIQSPGETGGYAVWASSIPCYPHVLPAIMSTIHFGTPVGGTCCAQRTRPGQTAMLTRLEVDGFKNLVDFTIDFGPLTCIAGPNGIGKSNISTPFTFCLYWRTSRLSRRQPPFVSVLETLTVLKTCFSVAAPCKGIHSGLLPRCWWSERLLTISDVPDRPHPPFCVTRSKSGEGPAFRTIQVGIWTSNSSQNRCARSAREMLRKNYEFPHSKSRFREPGCI